MIKVPESLKRCSLHLDGSMHVRLFDAQYNLAGDGDAIEKVVDETHVVNEGVNVAGAQHQQGGDQLNVAKRAKLSFLQTAGPDGSKRSRVFSFRLTVNSKAGIGVQRVT